MCFRRRTVKLCLAVDLAQRFVTAAEESRALYRVMGGQIFALGV